MMKIFMFLFMLNFLVFLNDLFLMIFMFNLLMILSFMFLFNSGVNCWVDIYSWMGMDYISYILIFLSILIISLLFISSLNFNFKKFYSFILLMLLMFLFLSFSSMNYFLFYLFFEISLIPTFLLIMGWGYQPERINASMYMLLYTLFASLPLLILLFYIYIIKGSLSYMFLLGSLVNFYLNNFLMFFFMVFAFLVKLPLFMFHLWLPKAHIEAPVTGSMILAAVLLKLGGYGCYRSMMMMMNLCKKFNFCFFGLSLLGMVYLSMISMRCNDLKLIIAYSSVVHMGMMFMGLISMSLVGFLGGFMMMIGHGFCSSALFYMLNCFYERVKSRSLLFIKGMMMFFPNLIMWWFIFSVINMAAPISLNLLSEILILISVLSWLIFVILFLGIAMYFSAMYSLFMYSYVSHGFSNNLLLKFNFIKVNEYLNIIIHWIPLNFLILKCSFFF